MTVTVKDAGGNNVAGETWPKSLTYVSASDGKYRATLTDVLILSKDATYYAWIDADGGADLRRHWEAQLIAKIST